MIIKDSYILLYGQTDRLLLYASTFIKPINFYMVGSRQPFHLMIFYLICNKVQYDLIIMIKKGKMTTVDKEIGRQEGI